MKPPLLDYVAAPTLEEALRALADAKGEAKLLAGGQSLMPMLNFRLARPRLLIDINRVPGLGEMREEHDCIRVGALVRHHALETSPVMAAHLPVVTAAMGHVAHLAVRNRGTIGGSLAHADPAAELPLLARLLDARITARSVRGGREIAAADLFASALTTTLAPDEILTEVVLPKLAPGCGWAFEEVARREGDFALAAVGAVLRLEGGRIAEARLALMGVGEMPLRATAAERLLLGSEPDDGVLAEAVASVRRGLSPMTDLHASADYRRHLAGVLTRRALKAALGRAGGLP